MNPIPPSSLVASSGPPSPRALPTQGQPSTPIHRLADVNLKELKSYSEDGIAAYLEKHEAPKMGVHAFDDCLFQSVLFTEFFEKIEAGSIEPGQPEHDLPAQYLLKKSAELLKPLDKKIREASQRYDEMVQNKHTPPELRAKLEVNLGFISGMVARFEKLERDLLAALAQPHTFSPTRDKACFLLFAHAMLADAANEAQRWMNDLAVAKPGKPVCLVESLPAVEEELVKNYVMIKVEVGSNLFSKEALTPADKTLYEEGLTFLHEADDDMKKRMVPSFSSTGSQGVLAILHGIFHGKGLMSGATSQPYPVHGNSFNMSYLATLRHDCAHLQFMTVLKVLSGIAPNLMPIYLELENRKKSTLPSDAVKKDLVVLFYILHENSAMFSSPNPARSFLDYARIFFCRDFVVVDMVPLLNKVGFSIKAIDEKSTPEDKAACYETVAQAMDELWKQFRERHADGLAASGVFAKVPKFLKD